MPLIKRSRKMIRKPKVVRKRTVAKKPARRVLRQAPVTKALSTIAVHHNTMLRSLFDHNYYEYKNCNEMESSRGAISVNLDTTSALNKLMPLHVYDLTSIVTDGQSPVAQYILNFNSSDYPFFTTSGSVVQVGANDGGGVPTVQSHNRTIQEYFDVRLELFARETKKTVWNVMLLKLFDEDIAPLAAADSTKAKHNNFWKQLVRPFYTNTLIPSDSRIMGDMKGKFKVLWQKSYTFKDKDSSFDEVQKKTVKIFKKLNQLNKYNESPEQKNYNDDNPNTQFVATAAGTTAPFCQLPKRIYMVIRANNTTDYNIGTNTWDSGASVPALTDIPSYNIYYRTKHMVPNNIQ